MIAALPKLDATTLRLLLSLQKAEVTDHVVYSRMARFEKHERHSQVLSRIAKDELEHYATWKQYTNRDVVPNRFYCACFTLLLILLGYTFVLRLMERGEQSAAKRYSRLPCALPEISEIIANEQKHE